MVNINATTPQLKLVKQWLEAHASRDIDKVAPIISKNFKFQAFPKTTDIPEEAKEGHLQRYRGILGALTNVEVRTQHWRTTVRVTICHLDGHSRSD